ncbi:MAG: sigma-70 family RNA polymerase sigma factor [Moraxellaceae bacterium]|nr:MAG: sigma-70 family RNA polymerase sigma factor [Moraxellaceae bacterium]
MDDPNSLHLRLLGATAQGDQAAFAQLYNELGGRLYAISLQLLRRRDLAEDAVQEAFVRIWHNASAYQQEKGLVLTWMISIVRYRALDMLRANKRRQETSRDDAEYDEPVDERGPDAELFEQRDRVRIDKCMDHLDVPQRDAIQLAYFKGFTHQEVCSHLDSPLGSVKSWIRRGLERLKRCLES